MQNTASIITSEIKLHIQLVRDACSRINQHNQTIDATQRQIIHINRETHQRITPSQIIHINRGSGSALTR